MFSDNANPLLVEVAGQLTAGRALGLGSGEGGDAVWLARRGWRVTAVDVSPTALARTASKAGPVELLTWVPYGHFYGRVGPLAQLSRPARSSRRQLAKARSATSLMVHN